MSILREITRFFIIYLGASLSWAVFSYMSFNSGFMSSFWMASKFLCGATIAFYVFSATVFLWSKFKDDVE